MSITLTPKEFLQQVESGSAVLLDVSPAHAYSKAHPAGSYNAPFHRQKWGEEIKRALNGQSPALGVFADNSVIADAAAKSLVAEGLSVPFVFSQGIKGWEQEGLPIEAVKDLTVDELAKNLDNYVVVDVREPYELRSGVVPGAINIPMGQLQGRVNELDKSKPHAIICASGNRSASAASWLSQQGLEVANVVGGMSLWMGGRHPVDRV